MPENRGQDTTPHQQNTLGGTGNRAPWDGEGPVPLEGMTSTEPAQWSSVPQENSGVEKTSSSPMGSDGLNDHAQTSMSIPSGEYTAIEDSIETTIDEGAAIRKMLAKHSGKGPYNAAWEVEAAVAPCKSLPRGGPLKFSPPSSPAHEGSTK